jgi:hypothetical protein
MAWQQRKRPADNNGHRKWRHGISIMKSKAKIMKAKASEESVMAAASEEIINGENQQ